MNNSRHPTTYRITLTPLSPFFFGGENTFGDDNRNYLVKSNYYPQQTTLLGFLRHLLLLENGLLADINDAIQDVGKASELIGEHSFEPTTDHAENKYGIIESLSSVFLLHHDNKTKKETAYWPAPLNEGYDKKEEKNDSWCLHIQPDNSCLSVLNSKQERKDKALCVLKRTDKEGKEEPYLAKNELEDYLLGSDNSTKRYEDVFKPIEKIGINRPNSHKPHTRHLASDSEEQDSGFYKQTAYLLTEGFSFAFYAVLSGNHKLQSEVVHMGAERSAFMMHVSEENAIPNNYGYASKIKGSVNSDKVAQIVLIADTYIEADLYDYCQFAITQTVPFRFLKTRLNQTKHYFDVSDEKTTAMKKSGKFQLLKRGSVLFVKKSDIENATKLIEKYKDFKQIGYNHFIIF